MKEIQKKLKKRLALGLNYGIKSIEEILPEDSSLQNDFINLQSQYNDLNRIASQNLLDYTQIELGFNKIRIGLITVIDKMEESDSISKTTLPALKNNEVQYRKNNFFQLLDIHFLNLKNIAITLSKNSINDLTKDKREGRDAFQFIYKDVFIYDYKNPRYDQKQFEGNIQGYAADFFTGRYARFEVYMKTVKFILDYIFEEELEQAFFLGAFKSILSTSEIATIFYYAISEVDNELKALIQKAELLDDAVMKKLIDSTHLSFLD